MSWLSWRNGLDKAALLASREVASLTIDRVRSRDITRRYRAAGLIVGDTATSVTIAFAAPTRPAVIAWIRPRRRLDQEEAAPPSFAATDTVRHRLSSTDAHDGDLYDSGVIASGAALGRGVHVHFPPAGAAGGFAKFDFDALSRGLPPENYVDWGYAHYGAIDFSPIIDYAGPATFAYEEGAERRLSWDGARLTVRRKAIRRRWRLIFESLKWPSEQAAYENFLAYVGDGGAFLVGLDKADGPNTTMIAMLDAAAMARTSRRRFRAELPILEAF